MTEEKKPTDWERIELDYRAGILTLREMASAHGISNVSIHKRAKRDGWVRAEKVRSLDPVVLRDGLDRSGFVYVIYLDDSAGERFYKIGMSETFSSRFSAHQCASPFQICVACAYFVGNMRMEERELHREFSSRHVRGEWFRLSDSDIESIAMRAKLI